METLKEFSDKESLCMNKPKKSVERNVMTYLLSINKDFHDFDDKNTAITSEDNIHFHHIIPLASASTIGKSTKEFRNIKHDLNVIMNMTPISASANLEIGRFTLKEYSARIGKFAKDCHLITGEWDKVSYDEKKPQTVRTLFETRFDNLSRDVRTKLKSYIG